ncbi:hypothetical protein [Nocardioides phosphati]|uniref:hypothetical protein n=1 Tax=Nocardioides phosphati TaxID=1867775 RepID=UPI00166D8FE8|nr:hypothetical protein [Nocardioides phosphati]
MILRRAVAPACLLLLPTIAACRTDVPATPPHPISTEVPAPAGERALDRARARHPQRVVTGLDYWFVAPKGFKPVPSARPAPKNLDVWRWTGPTRNDDGLAVTVLPPTPGDHRAQVRAWRHALKPWIVDPRVVRADEKLGSHPVIHLRGASTIGPKVLDIVLAGVNDHTYKIEFNLSSRHTQAERDAILRQVLRTWHWGLTD